MDKKEQDNSEFIFYQAEDGKTRVEVRLRDETVWLTRAGMADLYQTTPQNITSRLKAICAEGELGEQATCEEYLQVQKEGERQISRIRKFYDLSAILSVGYRVRSARGTPILKQSGQGFSAGGTDARLR